MAGRGCRSRALRVVAVKVAVDKKKVREIIGGIKKAGAEDILEYSLQKVIV